VAATIPVPAARHALLTSYQVGFTSTFDHLMGIAAVVAMVGAIGCLFLVRQKDFVPSLDAAQAAPGDDGSDGSDEGSAWSASAHAG